MLQRVGETSLSLSLSQAVYVTPASTNGAYEYECDVTSFTHSSRQMAD